MKWIFFFCMCSPTITGYDQMTFHIPLFYISILTLDQSTITGSWCCWINPFHRENETKKTVDSQKNTTHVEKKTFLMRLKTVSIKRHKNTHTRYHQFADILFQFELTNSFFLSIFILFFPFFFSFFSLAMNAKIHKTRLHPINWI